MPAEIKSSLHIPVGDIVLPAELIIPYEARGLVLFVHGSGSSRFSSRNMFVAERLRERLFGTLLFDLLTAKEDEVYSTRFDISLLTQRLTEVTRWVERYSLSKGLPLAYFGASTGAAAALKAAAVFGDKISAIVSRGGRPDLAMDVLPKVNSPVLLIVGSLDSDVITLNQMALKKIGSNQKELEIISGASHLFEEPGKLERVASLAGDWFEEFVTSAVGV
jgi:putative phosphoribosyl transferase